MAQNAKVEYWLDIARYDLGTSEAMLKAGKLLYVGFMCHQAIEKLLKGYFVAVKGNNPPFTHNLSYLMEECGLKDEFPEKYLDTVDILQPLHVEARYPTHKEKLLESLSKEKCSRMIVETQELFKWIESRLSRK